MNLTEVNTEARALEPACDVMAIAYQRGWISTRDGNISILASEDALLISPSGAVKHALTPARFVRASLLPLSPAQQAVSGASGEFELHRLLQARRFPGMGTVLHLHPTYIIAAMCAGYELGELSVRFPEVTRYTRVGRNVGALPATSAELAVACDEAFGLNWNGQVQIVGLENHGCVAIGADPWIAFEHVERLEHICKIVLLADAASGVRGATAVSRVGVAA